jgi:hypothetical protein
MNISMMMNSDIECDWLQESSLRTDVPRTLVVHFESDNSDEDLASDGCTNRPNVLVRVLTRWRKLVYRSRKAQAAINKSLNPTSLGATNNKKCQRSCRWDDRRKDLTSCGQLLRTTNPPSCFRLEINVVVVIGWTVHKLQHLILNPRWRLQPSCFGSEINFRASDLIFIISCTISSNFVSIGWTVKKYSILF